MRNPCKRKPSVSKRTLVSVRMLKLYLSFLTWERREAGSYVALQTRQLGPSLAAGQVLSVTDDGAGTCNHSSNSTCSLSTDR